jgi:hypothetical protein
MHAAQESDSEDESTAIDYVIAFKKKVASKSSTVKSRLRGLVANDGELTEEAAAVTAPPVDWDWKTDFMAIIKNISGLRKLRHEKPGQS